MKLKHKLAMLDKTVWGARYLRAIDNAWRIYTLVSLDVLFGTMLFFAGMYFTFTNYRDANVLTPLSTMVVLMFFSGMVLWLVARTIIMYLFWRSLAFALVGIPAAIGAIALGFYLLRFTWGYISQVQAIIITTLVWLVFVGIHFVPFIHALMMKEGEGNVAEPIPA